MADVTPEQLQVIRDQLREEIREARGMLKDLRHEVRTVREEIKTARELVPLLAEQLFEAEVKKQVDELTKVTKKAMSDTVARINETFDGLTAILMGESPEQRRSGEPSIPELIKHAARLREIARQGESHSG